MNLLGLLQILKKFDMNFQWYTWQCTFQHSDSFLFLPSRLSYAMTVENKCYLGPVS
jgi:hypothetical protein